MKVWNSHMPLKSLKRLSSHTSTGIGKCPKCESIIEIRVKYKMGKEVYVCPKCYHEFVI